MLLTPNFSTKFLEKDRVLLIKEFPLEFRLGFQLMTGL